MLAKALFVLAGVHQACSLAVPKTPFSLFNMARQASGGGASIPLEAVSDATFTKTINPRDIRYATTITVNGKDFKVLIDTGSIDLWLSTPEDFQAIDTGADAIAAFGAGVAAAFVNGTVSTATLQVGPFTLQNQGKSFFFLEHGAQSKFQVAFNNAKPETITATGVLELGLDGTLGIGPVGTFSPIAQGLTDARMDPSVGTPWLLRLFEQTSDPSQNNFFAVSLSRTGDQQGTADVSFTINEIDPTYSAIANTQPIPLFPSNTGVWSIPVDGISVDGANIAVPQSSVPGTPPGTTVFQLDTGTPTAAMSQQLLDAIYSQIPGSIFLQDQEMWTVPCNSTSILSLQIGGQEFPIHPLDLSDIMTLTDSNTVVCGSPFGIGSADTFDVLAGDSFMRNFYSLFNFGAADGSGSGPSIQLLPQTNAQTAGQDAINVRQALTSAGNGSSPAGSSPPAAAPPSAPGATSTRGGGSSTSQSATTSPSASPSAKKNSANRAGMGNGNILIGFAALLVAASHV